MKYSMMKIANRILDQLAELLVELDEISPECIEKLNMDTDIIKCFKLNALQIRLFKYTLRMKFNLPFDEIDIRTKELEVRRLITYIIVYSEDEMLYQWHDNLRVA